MKLLKSSIIYVIYGIIIGGGAILPGISGGVLCVVFGIYRLLMDFFAHPITSVKKNYKVFIALGIGWLGGFFLFAKLIEFMFRASEHYATWLFIGLIAGSAKVLYREAGEQGHPKNAWIGFTASFLLFFFLLFFIKEGSMVTVEPSVWWYAFCGILWGFSIVVPGMTSSSILMSMELYQPMTAGIAAFDLSVVIPWILGLLAVVLTFARLVKWLFERYYAISYHCVLGIVLASTFIIVPISGYHGIREVVLSLLCFGIGYIAATLTESFPHGETDSSEKTSA